MGAGGAHGSGLWWCWARVAPDLGRAHTVIETALLIAAYDYPPGIDPGALTKTDGHVEEALLRIAARIQVSWCSRPCVGLPVGNTGGGPRYRHHPQPPQPPEPQDLDPIIALTGSHPVVPIAGRRGLWLATASPGAR